jgi:hypothetical protein
LEAPDDDTMRVLAQRYARLVDELDIDTGEPLLVLPNAEFFPDRFTGDQDSVGLLLSRMQGYAGLEDVNVEAVLTGANADGEACGTGGCGTGACAPKTAPSDDGPRLERTADGYVVRVPAAELSHPVVMTARIATALGAIALAERHPRGMELAADPLQAEATAVALGFGVLLLEASYIYSTSCGGPNVQRATALGCDELAGLFALSLAREGHSVKAALGELATTQRAVLKQAVEVVDESRTLVELLKKHPERVARGAFRLREGGGFFSRLFGKRPAAAPDLAEREAAALRALERGASVEELHALVGDDDTAAKPRASEKKRPQDDELYSLVDEALGEARRDHA